MPTERSPEGRDSKYVAFVSYRHTEPDLSEAVRLQRGLEAYRVPTILAAAPSAGRRLGRVFVDRTELSAAPDLRDELRDRLEESRWLLVLGSPRARESRWMDEEIRHFRALGRVDRIIGVLLGGGPSREAFPPAMFEPRTAGAPPEEPLFVALADERGRRTRRSRHVARVRLVARMIGVEFDVLYRRELRRRRRDRAIALTVVAVALAAFGFLLHGLQTEREGRELADRRVATVASEKTSLITERADARARGERERRHRLATTLAVRATTLADEGDLTLARDAAVHALALARDATDDVRRTVDAVASDLAWSRGLPTPVPGEDAGSPTLGALSPDGRWCAIGGTASDADGAVGPRARHAGWVVLSDISADPPRRESFRLDGEPQGVAFVQEEGRLALAVAAPGDRLLLLDPTAAHREFHARRIVTPDRLDVSADGTLLVSDRWGWRLATPDASPFELPKDAGGEYAAVDAAGRRYAAASSSGALRVWDVPSGGPTGRGRYFDEGTSRTLDGGPSRVRGVAFADDGRRLLALCAGPAELLTWHVDGPPEARRIPARRLLPIAGVDAGGLRVARDGSWAMALGAGGRATVVSLASPGLPPIRPRSRFGNALPTQAFDATAARALVLDDRGGVVWSLDGWRLPRSLRLEGEETEASLESVTYVTAGRTLVAARRNVFGFANGAPTSPIELRTLGLDGPATTPVAVRWDDARTRSGVRVAVDPTASFVAVWSREAAWLASLHDLGGPRVPLASGAEVNDLKWSPDLRHPVVALATSATLVRIVGIADGRPVTQADWTLPTAAAELAFSADGTRLAARGAAGAIHVRNMTDGTVTTPPPIEGDESIGRILWVGDRPTLVAVLDGGSLSRWAPEESTWTETYRTSEEIRVVVAAGAGEVVVAEGPRRPSVGEAPEPIVLGGPRAGDAIRLVSWRHDAASVGRRVRTIDRALGRVLALDADLGRNELLVVSEPDLVEVLPLAEDAAAATLRDRGARPLAPDAWARLLGPDVPFAPVETPTTTQR